MDTMKDTKMQPAKDAVIEELSSAARRKEMTKDELQKAVDDVIADCIRNDYAFGSYAYKVAEAIWPLLEAAEKSDAESIAMYRRARDERDALRTKIEQMERQKPGFRERCTPSAPTGGSNRFPLYALPGAKGEEK